MPKWVSGESVGHYEIIDRLGTGGMGVTYLARDTRLGRRVVLKCSDDSAEDVDERAQALREARAVARIDHPNVCAVHEVREEAGRAFIVMAYIEGTPLDRLVEDGALPPKKAVDLAIQIATGLGAAHRAGILHRDIKPGNVIVTDEGVAKILDFGISARSGGWSEAAPSDGCADPIGGDAGPAPIGGTPAYMPPELVRGEEGDERADIWSACATLYEMLTGSRPFDGPYREAVAYAILNEPPGGLDALSGLEPEGLGDVVAKGLAKDPSERYRNVSELISALEAVLESKGAKEDRSRRRYRLGVAFLVVLLVIVTVVVSIDHVGRRSPDARVIAVLPFENLSPGKDTNYFSDGVTEDITSSIAGVEDLTVISRATVERYRTSKKTLHEIADELGAGSFLTGSVRRRNEDVRVVVHLVEPRDGREIWSQSYTRKLGDIFAIQSEVAIRVSEALSAHLSPQVRARLQRAPTAKMTAYDQYLRGRESYSRFARQTNEIAIDLFKRAIELDPQFALAYAGLADAYTQRNNAFGMDEGWVDSAIVACKKALAIQSDLPEAYNAVGTAYAVKGWLRRGLSSARTAVELSPSSASAVSNVAGILLSLGRCDEALPWAKRAVALSPGSAFRCSAVGTIHLVVGSDARASEWFRRALSIQPEFAFARVGLGYKYLATGGVDSAMACADRVLQRDPTDFFAGHLAGDVDLFTGRRDAAKRRYLRLLVDSNNGSYYSSRRPSTSLAYIYREEGLADSLRIMAELSKALDDVAIASGSEWPDIRFDLALAEAALGNRDRALAVLRASVGDGWRLARFSRSDPVLALFEAPGSVSAVLDSVALRLDEMRDRMADAGR